MLRAQRRQRNTVEIVERRAKVGIELLDAVTGDPISSTSRVSTAGADVLRATTSRWFVEGSLLPSATFAIDADGYLPETITVAVPPDTDPGAYVEVKLKPRTGYVFPPSLTRVIGLVVFDGSSQPARGVDVIVTPEHSGASGTPLTTKTTDDGQFAMWFVPQLSLSPPIADGYRVDAQIVIGGIPFTGALPSQALLSNQCNSAPTLRLSP